MDAEHLPCNLKLAFDKIKYSQKLLLYIIIDVKFLIPNSILIVLSLQTCAHIIGNK